MHPTTAPATPSGRALLLLIVAFGICIVGAGHGIAPIALILVYGWPAWAAPMTVGWTGVIALLLGWLRRHHGNLPIAHAGAVLTAVSWSLFMVRCEAFAAAFVFSLPYLVAVVWWSARALRPAAESA